MKKILSAVLLASAVSVSANAQLDPASYNTCTAQVLKKNLPNQTAFLQVVCGNQVVANSAVPAFDSMVKGDQVKLQDTVRSLVKAYFIQPTAVTCKEADSELFWIYVCHK